MKAADKTPKIRLGKPGDYPRLLSEIKERIRSAQYEALKAVNKEPVGLYWDIGRMIVVRQADAEHGSAIAERLSNDLWAVFPGISGFSRRNVFYMRESYPLYRDDERAQPLVAQIGWSHNLVILQRCKDPLEREFYIRMTRKYGWSKNVLIHQIDNQSYEKFLLGQTNFDQSLTPEPSASSFARRRIALWWNMHCTMPASPWAWPPMKLPGPCPSHQKVNCLPQKKSPS